MTSEQQILPKVRLPGFVLLEEIMQTREEAERWNRLLMWAEGMQDTPTLALGVARSMLEVCANREKACVEKLEELGYRLCIDCRGTGQRLYLPNLRPVTCHVCNGRGYIALDIAVERLPGMCPRDCGARW